MTPYCLLDANILLRHLMQDHADHSPRSTALINDLETGPSRARITDPVVFEAVFTLERFFRIPRLQIANEIRRLIALPGIDCPGIQLLRETFDVYPREQGLSFVDCHVAIEAIMSGVNNVVSFDRKLGRVPGVTRIEPPVDFDR